MAIEPIYGMYVHDETTDTDGIAKFSSEELEEIRVGADGTTYANAGDAVRGQDLFVLDSIRNNSDVSLTKAGASGSSTYIVLSGKWFKGEIIEVSLTADTTGTYNFSPTYLKEDGTQGSDWGQQAINTSVRHVLDSNVKQVRAWVSVSNTEGKDYTLTVRRIGYNTILDELDERVENNTFNLDLFQNGKSYEASVNATSGSSKSVSVPVDFKAGTKIAVILDTGTDASYDFTPSFKDENDQTFFDSGELSVNNVHYVTLSKNAKEAIAFVSRANVETTTYKYTLFVEGLVDINEKISILGSEIENFPNVENQFSDNSLLAMRFAIPEYYFAYPENPVSFGETEYLVERLNTVPNGDSFIFVTDSHWKTNNAKHSPELIKYSKDYLGINNVFFGGDVVNQDSTKYIASVNLLEYMNVMRDVAGAGFLPVHGDHDGNMANIKTLVGGEPTEAQQDEIILPYTVVFNDTLKHLENVVTFEDEAATRAKMQTTSGATGSDLEELVALMKLHYYYDDTSRKIRYIILDHNEGGYGVMRDYYGIRWGQVIFLQLDWLYQTIMSTPANYNICVFMHNVFEGSRDDVTDGCTYVAKLLSACKLKSTATINNTITNTALNAFYANGNHTYNFADMNTVGKCIIIGGHTHFDVAKVFKDVNGTFSYTDYNSTDGINNGEILMTTTNRDAYRVPSSYPEVGDDEPTMTLNTVTEQCFDIVTFTQNSIYYTRVGAGNSREFLFN